MNRLKAKTGKSRGVDIEKILKEVEKSLKNSSVKLPLPLKLKAAKIMLGMMNRERGFGLFVILGWKEKWNKHTDIPDSAQDIYARHGQNILQRYKTHKYDIEKTINFDGAILIDGEGNMVHSGIMIEGLRPRAIAQKVNPGNFDDLSDQFGFIKKVHARHLAAISASYIFKGTTVMTVSEETDSFHIFEGGKIIYRKYN